MKYKGYQIICEVNVNSQWEFEETPNGVRLTNFIDEGEADEGNISDFLVEDPSGEMIDWRDTLTEAKKLIDQEIKKARVIA